MNTDHEYNPFLCPRHFESCTHEPKNDDTLCCNPYHDPDYCNLTEHAVAP